MKKLSWLFALSLLGGCLSLAPEEDPVLLKLTELEERMVRVERVVDNESLKDLFDQLDDNQRSNANLLGRIEELTHKLTASEQQLAEVYTNLDSRLISVEQNSPASAAGAAIMPAIDGEGEALAFENDRVAYQYAFEALKNRKFEEAERGFTFFVKQYPESVLVDNAQYWLAETFYVRQQFQKAFDGFDQLLKQYPQSRKVPDALLKVGFCQIELGRANQGKETLRQVAERFPESSAARLAKERLANIS